MFKYQNNMQYPFMHRMCKKGSFKMHMSEIPEKQICVWCLQDLGYLLLLWALGFCSCLSKTGSLISSGPSLPKQGEGRC